MYAPDKYREQRQDVLFSAIKEIMFATVVGSTPDGPEAVHVPLLIETDGDDVWLDGHVSRNNPVVRLLGEGAPVLAAFIGPHAYVSPNWMKETDVSGRTAPRASFT